MSNPSFSIIMSTINASKTSKEARLSIANQNYTNCEFLNIYGASTDNAIKIIGAHKDIKGIIMHKVEDHKRFIISQLAK